MSGGLRDLKVWQEAVALAADVVRALRPANKREIKGVLEDAMRSATASALRVADGYSRYDPAEQHRLYTAARRELARLETHLAIVRQAELLSIPVHQGLVARIAGVNRLLGGFLIYLDRQAAQGSGQRASASAAAPAVPAGMAHPGLPIMPPGA